MKRRIKRITVETKREVIFPMSEGQEAWCSQCGDMVQILESAQAAALLRLNTKEREALFRRDEVHVIEDAGNRTLICRDSLPQHTKRRM